MSDETMNMAASFAVRKSLHHAVEHSVDALTAIPGAGKVAGQAVDACYAVIPNEVKAGAGAGGILAVHAGTHIMSIGTAGSMAYGVGFLAAMFAPFVIAGAAVGGLVWAANKITGEQ